MPNLSWSELAVVLVLAIFLIKPGDVPEIMRAAGKLIGKTRKLGADFMRMFEDAAGEERIQEFRNQIDREQKIIGKMIDMEGNVQEMYDVKELEREANRSGRKPRGKSKRKA